MARRVRCLSHQVYALEYKHAESARGANYRHDFTDPDVDAWLMDDGSVQLVSKRGRRLWDEFTVRDGE